MWAYLRGRNHGRDRRSVIRDTIRYYRAGLHRSHFRRDSIPGALSPPFADNVPLLDKDLQQGTDAAGIPTGQNLALGIGDASEMGGKVGITAASPSGPTKRTQLAPPPRRTTSMRWAIRSWSAPIWLMSRI